MDLITPYTLIDKFNGSDVFSITLENEPIKTRHWVRLSEVVKVLDFKNGKETVELHCKDWQYREFKLGPGRPALYVCFSGLMRLCLRSKSNVAIEFQDWLTEELLPKLSASGAYIMPTATSDQLEALMDQIKSIQDVRRMDVIKQLASIVRLDPRDPAVPLLRSMVFDELKIVAPEYCQTNEFRQAFENKRSVRQTVKTPERIGLDFEQFDPELFFEQTGFHPLVFAGLIDQIAIQGVIPKNDFHVLYLELCATYGVEANTDVRQINRWFAIQIKKHKLAIWCTVDGWQYLN